MMVSADARNRALLRERLADLLDSRRDVVSYDNQLFEVSRQEGLSLYAAPIWALRLVDDWAADEEIKMGLEEFLSGMLFGTHWDGESGVLQLLNNAPRINPKAFGR